MHNDSSPAPQPTKRPKFWLAIRIEQYTVQFLTAAEEWEQYSQETYVSDDREAVFQAGRANGGLLCRADAIMSAGQASSLKDRLRLLMPQPPAHGGSDATTAASA